MKFPEQSHKQYIWGYLELEKEGNNKWLLNGSDRIYLGGEENEKKMMIPQSSRSTKNQ